MLSLHFVIFQMAYESLALVSNALSRLEAGQIGVCRSVERERERESSIAKQNSLTLYVRVCVCVLNVQVWRVSGHVASPGQALHALQWGFHITPPQLLSNQN